ncbi:undecaprenyl-diphosphate phosphatase [Oceanomicrobium pacificus]|uniref:Undecaprenyl-diphosphatase n=1 Tax=Oceanomicrobium pacificus TaxID=2692916 RepID=A0A6B0TJQ7_9RHOB|nr:undecaprenyl-diphosphate phosphatase [Oceanomicrobium pacificus]MXU64677.1 undecaprenyl-diphosphate phosphatase [Oceanomicrobium pacificus]
MSLLYLLILALVQGVTEFLPVSSSAHLILLPRLLGTDDQGLALDVAVHVGTLVAVILFFRAEVAQALRGTADLLRGRTGTAGARLALGLVIATIPVVIGGLVLKVTGLYLHLRSVAVIGWAMILFGVLLWLMDQRGAQEKRQEDWSLRDAWRMGLWQALALIPGTSRSGAAITGSRALGYRREDGARIAMLMSIPTIIASGVLLGADLAAEGDAGIWRDAAIAAAMACGAALVALSLMMRLLRSVSYTPYVIYRFALGAVLLLIAYG